MTAFGLPVEPDVQQEFRDRVRADRLVHCVEMRMQWRSHQIRESGDVTSRHRATRRRDLDGRGYVGGQRIGEFRGVVGEDEAGRQQLHQIAELAVVPRHQRIGRRHRAEGNAGIERAERDQRMIDRVAGENDDRLLGRKAARQQRGCDVPRRRQQFRIGDLPPAPRGVSLRHEDPIGRGRGPMMQAVGDAHRIVAQLRFRAQIDGAVVAALDMHRGRAERDRAQRMIGARG